jgi:hypothetical protein
MTRSARPRTTDLSAGAHQPPRRLARVRNKDNSGSLSGSFHERLSAYALAASAAGVSLLALAQPAEGRIVYTHTNRIIEDGDSFRLDLNHDRLVDLTFQNKRYAFCSPDGGICNYTERLTLKAARGNQVVYNSSGAAALKPGVQIGPKRAFYGGVQLMASIKSLPSHKPTGDWINVKSRYLGVKFKIKGQFHYGWARLSVQALRNPEIIATLTGFAYETIPNKPIIAGKTADEGSNVKQPNPASLTVPVREPLMLGLLAMGAPGLSIWRREDSVGVGR